MSSIIQHSHEHANRPRRIGTMMGVGVILLSVSIPHIWPTLLVWNGSASAPLGLYVASQTPLQRGDFVLSNVPIDAQKLILERHYLPAHVPILKRIAAMKDDTVCRIGLRVVINGTVKALAQLHDPEGRMMPVRQGCTILKPGQLFLLLDNPLSFDGRYFGITKMDNVIAKVRPLWTYGKSGADGGLKREG